MPTPLYDALRGYAAKAPLRFHMPGHKGAFLPCPELAPLARLDVTEIPSTGNLYEDLSPIREAQAPWAPSTTSFPPWAWTTPAMAGISDNNPQ